MSCVGRKLAFCICEDKGAEQLHGKRAADLCYVVSTFHLLPKSEMSSRYPAVAIQVCFCWILSETPNTGFLMTRLLQRFSNERDGLIFGKQCTMFLAHLSQRLIGELIGYSWSGVRPSSVVVRPSVRPS